MENVFWRFREHFAEGNRKDEMHRAVLESEIYCPSPIGFNDPFDVNPVIKFSSLSIEEQVARVHAQIERNNAESELARIALARAEAGYMNTPEYQDPVRENFLCEIRNTPVLSLFSTPVNPAMWAYYGGNGSGYAIGLRFRGPLPNGEYPLPVHYSQSRPLIDFSDDVVSDPDAQKKFMMQCFLTKAKVWNKEGEHRLVFMDNVTGYREFGSERVVAICLGLSPTDAVLEAVKELRDNAPDSVQFLQIALSEESYDLEIKQLEE